MESPLSPERRRHTGFLTAGAVVAMVLAGLGIAGAQTSEAPTTQAPAGQERQAPAGEARRGGPKGGPVNLGVAAGAIGISVDELRAALRSGQSIAQVAQSRNVDVQKVIDALVAEATSRLAAEVAAGRLTQAQADEKAANLTQRIAQMVNRTGGAGGRGHKQGPPPADAPAPGATPAAATA